MKSLLFVPADSERKLAKAESCGADALAIDLEDAVLPDRKPLAARCWPPMPRAIAARASCG